MTSLEMWVIPLRHFNKRDLRLQYLEAEDNWLMTHIWSESESRMVLKTRCAWAHTILAGKMSKTSGLTRKWYDGIKIGIFIFLKSYSFCCNLLGRVFSTLSLDRHNGWGGVIGRLLVKNELFPFEILFIGS